MIGVRVKRRTARCLTELSAVIHAMRQDVQSLCRARMARLASIRLQVRTEACNTQGGHWCGLSPTM
jgi:hypothetical protein